MKRVLFKIILPSVLLAFWIMICYSIFNKPEGLDTFQLEAFAESLAELDRPIL